MKNMDWLCITFIIIGALNWGLVGFFNFDLVSAVFNGNMQFVARIIFAVVGLSGLYCLSLYSRMDYHDTKFHFSNGKK